VVSAAQFRATTAGTLNLATAVPVAGSYHVADAGGLLWSLQPDFPSTAAAQFISDWTCSVTVSVVADGGVQASMTLIRQGASPASAQTVARDGFASTLFVPHQTRPGAPAIVVIGGSEGGEDVLAVSALAADGYPVLALGYFGEPGLPQCLCGIPLEYFARAVTWLHAQPAARGRPVILIGTSRGAEGALLIASCEPHLFSAVVANSPSSMINGPFGIGSARAVAAWTFRGQPLSGGAIPVAGIRIPVLLSDGGQDQVWPSAESATTILQELSTAHDAVPRTSLYYPGAGHGAAGSPPCYPYPGIGSSEDTHGGTGQANALAAEQFWAKMIQFISNPAAPLT